MIVLLGPVRKQDESANKYGAKPWVQVFMNTSGNGSFRMEWEVEESL